jgi:hypothetical protein
MLGRQADLLAEILRLEKRARLARAEVGSGSMAESLAPVNVSLPALTAAVAQKRGAGPTEDLETSAQVEVPSADSLATWQQESYQLDAKFAASVGFPLWGAETTDHLKVMLFGISRYEDVRSGVHVYRYGVAIRVLLEIFDSENQAKVSLPAIAAQVELDILQANSQLIVLGYVGNIGPQLPDWQAFDVNNYANYMAAVSKLQAQVFGDVANTKPVLLSSTLASELKDHDTDVQQGFWHRHFHWNH